MVHACQRADARHHLHTFRGQSRTLAVFFQPFLPTALRQGLSLNRKLILDRMAD